MPQPILLAEPGMVLVVIPVVIAALYLLVRGMTNPRTRPFVFGLLGLCGVLFLFFFFARSRVASDEAEHWQAKVQEEHARFQQEVNRMRTTEAERARRIVSAKGAAIRPVTESNPPAPAVQPKTNVAIALLQALGNAWNKTHGGPAKAAPAATKKPAAAEKHDGAPAQPEPPEWVNAAPALVDGIYQVSLHVGPYTTPLECEREAPKALQAAVAEYAGILLGSQAATGVSLPDDLLLHNVSDRWTENRPFEIAGGTQDMVMLHLRLHITPALQQQIRDAAERAIVDRRLKDAGGALGGVLCLLALAWGGLRLANK